MFLFLFLLFLLLLLVFFLLCFLSSNRVQLFHELIGVILQCDPALDIVCFHFLAVGVNHVETSRLNVQPSNHRSVEIWLSFINRNVLAWADPVNLLGGHGLLPVYTHLSQHLVFAKQVLRHALGFLLGSLGRRLHLLSLL